MTQPKQTTQEAWAAADNAKINWFTPKGILQQPLLPLLETYFQEYLEYQKLLESLVSYYPFANENRWTIEGDSGLKDLCYDGRYVTVLRSLVNSVVASELFFHINGILVGMNFERGRSE